MSTRPLRVLLVSHYYPPHVGGIENVVRREAEGLAAQGNDVTVVTSAGRSSVTVEHGVRVVRVAAWNGTERKAGVPFPVFSPALAAVALRWARHADAVHIHDCLYLSSWAAGLAAKLTRTPYVLTQHVAVVDHPSGLVRAVQRVVYGVAGRALLRGARAVFTLNSSVAGFVETYGARRRHHLANGVDTDRFRPAASAAERARARERFALPADRVLVLFVGRLVPKKGYDLLLAAHTPDAGYDLVFSGGGDTEALAGRAGVHHLGALDPEAVAEAYRACDVFALPSTAEGFPLTVQEAMASGLPVVTTDDPGYSPYALDRDQVSLLPREVPVLAAELRALAADPERRSRMGTYSRTYAEKAFAWDDHVRTLLEHYGGGDRR
ncbi:glycosyltransferase family 4 protein [Streptomyces fulvoviolaceus]|uniref:glycosyltransferase family 4 protein n=1 Tax=Streptomyces fulvoviolaceus TaxID=285535 RepID=UPI0004CA9259|nr:glycosyltransferase family 4 protein [Streptomyces fulvoviolaceus]MCT9082295.1 glycosyltransferase family 4 protein [Streptomyces fulvoviolaceus]